jgi:predicted RNA-binding protein with RPS1 domain
MTTDHIDAETQAQAEVPASPELPAAEQPLAEQPAAEQPSAEQPSAEQPAAEQPVAEQPAAEQPVAEQPMAEQPAAEQPVAEQPAAEQPVAEQPAAEQPVVEQPAAAPEAAKAEASDERRKRAEATWKRLSAAKESGDVLTGKVKSEIKGGLLLDVEGYRAFLPASQARVAKGEALTTLVNTSIPLKVIDVDEKRKRLVVSQRRALDEARRTTRKALLQSLRVGEEREATVVRMADFGAFVDLGGIDALIPVSELAFERVERPSDVVSIGDKLKVRVIRVDEGGKKIAVSRKGALADPWRDHADILKQGTTVEGKVVAKEPRMLVEIAPGVTGTLSDRDANPEEYEIGEAIEVTVRSVDFRNRRIRLGTPHSASSFSSSSFAPLGTELKK